MTREPIQEAFHTMFRILAITAVVLSGVAPGASAETFLVQTGDDSSPYAFLPSLPRGQRDTLYAFTGDDEGGLTHDFETYLRMDLPPELMGAGDEVTGAYLWVYYSFDFTGFGEGSDGPGEMVLHEVLQPWDEASMDWSDRPLYGPPLDVHPDIQDLGLIWFDVTGLVRAWLNGAPNHGVALTNSTERLIGMYSFEANVQADLRPNLVIETVPEPGRAALATSALLTLGFLARRRRRRTPHVPRHARRPGHRASKASPSRHGAP